MPSQLRFEGPTLEDLLEEVYESYGPDVNIAEANKIRKGGVGGFFAKEVYEVVVDLDADTDPAGATLDLSADTGGEPAARPRSILDLVDERDSEDRLAAPETVAELVRRSGDDGIAELMAATRQARTPTAPAEPERAPTGRRTISAEELFGGRSTSAATSAPTPAAPAPHRSPAQPPPLSTEGEGFADVLARLAREADAGRFDPAPAAADEPFVGLVDQQVVATPDPSPAPAPADEADVPDWVVEHRRRAAEAPAADAAPAAAPSVEAEAEITPVTPEPEVAAAVAPEPEREFEPEAPVADPAPYDHALDDLAVAAPVRDQGVVLPHHRLVDLGVPLRYLAPTESATTHREALVELAGRFPTPAALSTGPDDVIVLIGDRKGLNHAATHLRESCWLSADDVFFATRRDVDVAAHRRIDSIESAIARRRSWRGRGRPTIVVVDEAPSRARATWGRELLEVLRPTTTWVTVEARRKSTDVADWVRRLGGAEALVVYGTDDTASPADVLGANLPVAMIDGETATPARWADLLDDRLHGS